MALTYIPALTMALTHRRAYWATLALTHAACSHVDKRTVHLLHRYLPFHLIHGPNQVPPQFLALYPELDENATASSQGMCGVCECKGIGGRPTGRQGGMWDARSDGNDVTWSQVRTNTARPVLLVAAFRPS
jgi:hypothetical protein